MCFEFDVGTGKTYIGLRIIEALPTNTKQIPILIVCYTNHALDQFLEGILKFCTGYNELIRIGGNSQCEALKMYNLSNIRSKRQSPKLQYALNGSKRKLNKITQNISSLKNQIEVMTDTVLGDDLSNVIQNLNNENYDQLNILARGHRLDEAIFNWLGYVFSYQKNEPNEVENNNDDQLEQDVPDALEEVAENEVVQWEDSMEFDENSEEESDLNNDVHKFDHIS